MSYYADVELSEPLAAGKEAPDFRLPSGPEQDLQLSDLRGQPVILAFYPADWSPVCSDQMVLYQELTPEFERYDAALLGISVDSVWCHQAFARHRNIRLPLLSDFEPKGEVSRTYRATGRARVSARGRCSCSTRKGSSTGATSRPPR